MARSFCFLSKILTVVHTHATNSRHRLNMYNQKKRETLISHLKKADLRVRSKHAFRFSTMLCNKLNWGPPFSSPSSPTRWSLPLRSAREVKPGNSLHPLSCTWSPAVHRRTALPCLAGRSGPVWPRMAGWRQRPLPYQRPAEELRWRRARSEDCLQQSQPHRLPRHHSPVRRLLLRRYW